MDMPMPMPNNNTYDGMVYNMQMTLSLSGMVDSFLFKKWMAMTPGVFFLLMLVSIAIVVLTNFVSMLLTSVTKTKDLDSSTKNKVIYVSVYSLLRFMDYLQMLIIMSTYNMWILLTIIFANGMCFFVFGELKDRKELSTMYQKVADSDANAAAS